MNGKQIAMVSVGVLTAGVLLYFFGSKLLRGAGGLLSGNNSLTKGTPYAGAGVVGTAGAATNKVLGGAPQAIGERLGDTLYSWFGHQVNPNAPIYLVMFPDGKRHAVDSNAIDQSGYFTYQGIRFKLGMMSGQRAATRVSTGTGGV